MRGRWLSGAASGWLKYINLKSDLKSKLIIFAKVGMGT